MDDFNFKKTKLAHIPLDKIRESTEALRDVVDKESEKYQEALDSVRKRGILKPILVREINDPVTGELLYGLIDGLQRFNWAMDAGMKEIPANIGSLEDADLLEAQMISNLHVMETKPIEYTKALLKVLGANPTLTKAELGARLSKSDTWVVKRLGLLDLKEDIQKMVDSGTLNLTNAYALSQLPHPQQDDLLASALAKSPAEFVTQADNLRKELAKARREGRQADVDTFVPTARLQRLAAIKDEAEASAKKPELSSVVRAAKEAGATTVEAAVAYALAWTLHLDPVSQGVDKAKWEATKSENKAKAQKRAEAKAAAKEAAAKVMADAV